MKNINNKIIQEIEKAVNISRKIFRLESKEFKSEKDEYSIRQLEDLVEDAILNIRIEIGYLASGDEEI